MATLLRAVRKATLASRGAAAAASRAAVMASRSARAAGVPAAADLGLGVLCPLESCPCPAPGGDVSLTMKPPEPFPSIADYPRLPGKPITPSSLSRGSSIRRSATLLRAVRKASLASRAAAAAASRAAVMASRSARAAGLPAAANLGSGVLCSFESCPCPAPGGDVSTTTKPPEPFPSIDDYPRLPDHATIPTDKDMASDEGVWALYERWCKVFKKQHDPAEMARRFKIFRDTAQFAYSFNTYVPDDVDDEEYLQKRREAKLMLLKGEDVSDLDDCYVPYQFGPFSGGFYPFSEADIDLLKRIEADEASITVKDVIAE